MSWVVGQQESNGAVVIDGEGSEVTSGTATIRYVMKDDDTGDTLYLQDDETTMSSTYNEIDVTHTANEGFVHVLTVPESMENESVTFIFQGPNEEDEYSETHYVTENDLDAFGPVRGASVKDPSSC